MITKKVCIVGSFSVGKTSLIKRYVYSIFSDDYLSTVGVKISKKSVSVDGQDVNLMLWDLEGKDDFSEINASYLRGAMGVLIVVDGLRAETLTVALALKETVERSAGPIPQVFLINKADVEEKWEIPENTIVSLRNNGLHVLKTSAKDGLNVDQAFHDLTAAMLRS